MKFFIRAVTCSAFLAAVSMAFAGYWVANSVEIIDHYEIKTGNANTYSSAGTRGFYLFGMATGGCGNNTNPPTSGSYASYMAGNHVKFHVSYIVSSLGERSPTHVDGVASVFSASTAYDVRVTATNGGQARMWGQANSGISTVTFNWTTGQMVDQVDTYADETVLAFHPAYGADALLGTHVCEAYFVNCVTGELQSQASWESVPGDEAVAEGKIRSEMTVNLVSIMNMPVY